MGIEVRAQILLDQTFARVTPADHDVFLQFSGIRSAIDSSRTEASVVIGEMPVRVVASLRDGGFLEVFVLAMAQSGIAADSIQSEKLSCIQY